MDQEVDNIVSKLGPPLPENETGKMSYLHVLFINMCINTYLLHTLHLGSLLNK